LADYVIIINLSSSAAFDVTLPNSPTQGRIYIIKDGAGNSALYPITIDVAGGGSVDGEASYTISMDYGSRAVIYTGTAGVWNVI
jgi:hypothetical protein